MLIAGRVVQGIGASGISVLIEIIVCDLVPLRQRGLYFTIILGLVAVGTALGPLFGGLIAHYSSWRWIFYLNLPLGGFTLVLLTAFLHLHYDWSKTLATRIKAADFPSMLLFVSASSAVLLALSWAGPIHSWSSYQVLVPLISGFAGIVAVGALESSRFASNPVIRRLFANRTSATAFALTFVHGMLAIWTVYFLPLYFQGVLGSSPSYSGVQLLPTILIILPFGAAAGIYMTRTGRYRSVHFTSFALNAVGYGLFTLLDERSPTGAWVGYQAFGAAGTGLILPTLLPAVMAPLDEADVAVASAIWAFVRNFGLVWGIAIPGAIFTNRIKQQANTVITDPYIRGILTNGLAYGHASPAFLHLLPAQTRQEVVKVIRNGLKQCWQVAIGFSLVGFLLVALERQVPLRNTLRTDFGIMLKEKTAESSSMSRLEDRCSQKKAEEVDNMTHARAPS